MNNRLFLIAILINLSVQVFGQDVVPRQAPIDNMSSFEDSMKNDKGDNPEFTKIPIIIDSTEGWEWIDKEALSKEPVLALYADNGGLELIYRLIDQVAERDIKHLILESSKLTTDSMIPLYVYDLIGMDIYPLSST